MSKSPQYKVIVWGQKGQKSGTRIISKKPYNQLGSARSYAQKQSAVKSRAFVVHYVELLDGKDPIERFKNGDIQGSKLTTPISDPKGLMKKSAAHANSNAGKYEEEVRKHAAGKIKWLPKAAQYGLSKAEAKDIRDIVRATGGTPTSSKPSVKQKRKPAATAAKRQQVREQLNTLQIDAAMAEAAMSALLREKQAAIVTAQADFEDTLARAAQMGVHASIR